MSKTKEEFLRIKNEIEELIEANNKLPSLFYFF